MREDDKMQVNNSATATSTKESQDKPTMTKKLGHTTYEIHLHFSQTSKETFCDKVLRLIQNDINVNKIS